MSEEQTTRLANPKQLVALAKALNQNHSKRASLAGEIGQRIQHAVENGNLHPKAFKFCCGLARMYERDEHKANEFWRNVNYYFEEFEKAGLFGEKHVGDIDQMAREAADEEDPDAKAARENTALLEGGITPIPDVDPEADGTAQTGAGADSDKEFDDATSSKPSRRRPAAEPASEREPSYRLQ